MWTVTKEFSFEAAHSLPHLPPDHKCRHLHGHSYKVVIECCGELDPRNSWVIDYAEIADAMQPIIASLDHKNLNDVLGGTTTAEMLAFQIYEKVKTKLPNLAAVHVKETENTSVTYRP